MSTVPCKTEEGPHSTLRLLPPAPLVVDDVFTPFDVLADPAAGSATEPEHADCRRRQIAAIVVLILDGLRVAQGDGPTAVGGRRWWAFCEHPVVSWSYLVKENGCAKVKLTKTFLWKFTPTHVCPRAPIQS
jgi:hypothetical protein